MVLPPGKDERFTEYLINQHDAAGQLPLLLHFLTTLHVLGASCTHRQEYNNCICSLWHKYASDDRLSTWQSLNSGRPMCTCARGCIYSCTPDDGCKKHLKHVE